MTEDILQQVQSNPAFSELVHKKTSLGWTLTLAMLAIYFGFILVLAFAPAALATPLFAGGVMTIGIPVGVLIIVSAFVLTGIYVRKANTEFDQLTHEIVVAAKLHTPAAPHTPTPNKLAEEVKQ